MPGIRRRIEDNADGAHTNDIRSAMTHVSL